MLAILARHWWVFAVRGLVAILFGILAIAWPLLTLQTLILLFGAYALVDGVFSVIAGIGAHERNERWWMMLLEGGAGILIGVMAFLWPGATALVLLYFIAAWAIITGVMEIVAAIRLRRMIANEWLMVVAGAASIVFGLILFVFPGAGALSLVWLIGVYSLAFGILLIMLAWRLRGMPHAPGTTGASPVPPV
jgi:uncharacterized membrane protein HdeD (DUF308 family)